MADIVLFHHVQGLTDGVRGLADTLREAGHTVHTPDVFDGATFDTLDAGIDHAREVGFGTLLERGVEAGEALESSSGDGLVYAGISLGVMAAQQLAQTRPGARGAVLLAGCIPPEEFGDGWPTGLPAQVHGMDADPVFADEGDLDAARELAAANDEVELFTYPGSAHLFMDTSLDAHDAEATDLVVQRVLAFLAGLG